MHLSNLDIAVVEEFPDGDRITATYAMPIVLDEVVRDAASEIVAYHLNVMMLELKALDSRFHTMQ